METRKDRLRLLLSVRNAAEAEIGITHGVDYIDVKEPRRGPLGRVDPETSAAVVSVVGGRRPVSVALGELREWGPEDGSKLPLLHGVDRVKVGLSGCASLPDWELRLGEIARSLPSYAGLVAVQYADWRSCDGPSPQSLLDAACWIGCTTWLIDTFDKSLGPLLNHLSAPALAQLVAAARRLGMTTVAAGSLTEADFGTIEDIGADLVAVRGAACDGGARCGQICDRRVIALRESLAPTRANSAKIS